MEKARSERGLKIQLPEGGMKGKRFEINLGHETLRVMRMGPSTLEGHA